MSPVFCKSGSKHEISAVAALSVKAPITVHLGVNTCAHKWIMNAITTIPARIRSAVTKNLAGIPEPIAYYVPGRIGEMAGVPVHGDGDVVEAGWFGHAWRCRSGI